ERRSQLRCLGASSTQRRGGRFGPPADDVRQLIASKAERRAIRARRQRKGISCGREHDQRFRSAGVSNCQDGKSCISRVRFLFVAGDRGAHGSGYRGWQAGGTGWKTSPCSYGTDRAANDRQLLPHLAATGFQRTSSAWRYRHPSQAPRRFAPATGLVGGLSRAGDNCVEETSQCQNGTDRSSHKRALIFGIVVNSSQMPKLLLFVALIFCSSAFSESATSAPPITVPVTDPRQITSRVLKREVQPFSIEKLYMTRVVGATSWSPDGKQVAFVTNISGRNNVWLTSSDGGWPSQLTIGDQRQTDPAWSPNGKWISFASDHDGDEQWDLFLVSPQTGEVLNLTNTPDVAEEGQAWSPDSRYLAYMSKPRSSANFEINLIDVLTKRYRALTTGTPKNLSNTGPIWSADGKTIAYTQQDAAGKNSNIYLLEVATGKTMLLTPHTVEHNYQATAFSPDSKYLLITSNAKGYDNAALLELAN